MVRSFVPLPLVVACAFAASPAFATDPQSLQEFDARIRRLEALLGQPAAAQGATDAASLDARLRVLEQALAARTSPTPVPSNTVVTAPAATPAAPDKTSADATTLSFGDTGVSLKSPVAGGSELRLRGLFQYDGRQWFDSELTQDSTFLMRRAEPTLEGNIGALLAFRFTPQFAGDSASVSDAYLDLRLDSRAGIRFGKTKVPLGLERLQSSGATSMVENGFPSELAPGRDLGVMLQGKFDGSGLSYNLGAFNGTVDGRDGATTNPDGDLEYAARVFFEPWKGGAGALSGLGFGLAGTWGEANGTGNDFLPRYRTPGQVVFFNYRSDVAADGTRARFSPQAYWAMGRFGILGEYVESKQDIVRGDVADTLTHRAWQASASISLTGEDVSWQGIAKPESPFAIGDGGWGALELTLRYGVLDIDGRAFPVFASPDTAAAGAHGWGFGFNWYLNRNFKLVADYLQTSFDTAPGGIPRDDEHVLLTRAQFSF